MTETKHKIITNGKPNIDNMPESEAKVFYSVLLQEVVKSCIAKGGRLRSKKPQKNWYCG